jgi:hypothetical protein
VFVLRAGIVVLYDHAAHSTACFVLAIGGLGGLGPCGLPNREIVSFRSCVRACVREVSCFRGSPHDRATAKKKGEASTLMLTI